MKNPRSSARRRTSRGKGRKSSLEKLKPATRISHEVRETAILIHTRARLLSDHLGLLMNLICHYDEALDRLASALSEFRIEGIHTTLAFHRQIVGHPVFRSGRYDTGFIDAHWKPGR